MLGLSVACLVHASLRAYQLADGLVRHIPTVTIPLETYNIPASTPYEGIFLFSSVLSHQHSPQCLQPLCDAPRATGAREGKVERSQDSPPVRMTEHDRARVRTGCTVPRQATR